MSTRPQAIDPQLFADRADLRLPEDRLRHQLKVLFADAIAAARGRLIETRSCACGCGKLFRVGGRAVGLSWSRRIYYSKSCKQRAFIDRRRTTAA